MDTIRRTPATRSLSGVAVGMQIAFILSACGGGSRTDPDAGADDVGNDVSLADVAADTIEAETDADGGDVADTESIALDAFVEAVCSAQAEWWCATRTTCGCPDAGETGCHGAAYLRCSERIGGQVGANPERWVADAAETERCVAALAVNAIDCGGLGGERLDAACGGALSLAVGIGAVCEEEGAPCASGQGACSGGRCAALPTAGETCRNEGSARTCGAGLTCIGGTCSAAPVATGMACDTDGQCEARARCIGGACVAGASAGEACDAARPCLGATTCADGVCVEAEPGACSTPGEVGPCGTEGICGAERTLACGSPADIGAPCTETAQCIDGSFCDTVVGQCVAAPGDGAPCGDGVWCAAGLACGFDSGVCAPLPQVGEECALGLYGPFVCDEGLACVGRRCGPLPGEGEECGGGAVCAAGLGCAFEGDISRCRTQRGAGEPCDNDTICVDGTHCNFATNTCREHFVEGQLCAQGNECGPAGSCVPDEAGRFVCVPLPEDGEPCLFECADGLRCRVSSGPLACFASVCAVGG